MNGEATLFVGDALDEVFAGEDEIHMAVVIEVGLADPEDLMSGEGDRWLPGKVAGAVTPVEISPGRTVTKTAFVVEEDHVRGAVIVDVTDGVGQGTGSGELGVVAEVEMTGLVPVDVGMDVRSVGDVGVAENDFRITVFVQIAAH